MTQASIDQVEDAIVRGVRHRLAEHAHAVRVCLAWDRLHRWSVRLGIGRTRTSLGYARAWEMVFLKWSAVVNAADTLRAVGHGARAEWVLWRAKEDVARAWPGRTDRLPSDGRDH